MFECLTLQGQSGIFLRLILFSPMFIVNIWRKVSQVPQGVRSLSKSEKFVKPLPLNLAPTVKAEDSFHDQKCLELIPLVFGMHSATPLVEYVHVLITL